MTTTFGISDSKIDKLSKISALGFSEKQPWLVLQLRVGREAPKVVTAMNNYGFVKFLQRYIATYNRKNQKAGFIPAKFEIKSQNDFVIFGMQGGH